MSLLFFSFNLLVNSSSNSLNEPASQLIGESSSKLGVDNFNDFPVDVGNEHIQAKVLSDGDEELGIDVIRDGKNPVP